MAMSLVSSYQPGALVLFPGSLISPALSQWLPVVSSATLRTRYIQTLGGHGWDAGPAHPRQEGVLPRKRCGPGSLGAAKKGRARFLVEGPSQRSG